MTMERAIRKANADRIDADRRIIDGTRGRPGQARSVEHRRHFFRCPHLPATKRNLMSVAYYIVLDTEEPGFDTFVNGKHLAHEEGIDELCRQLEIRTFDDYLSMSADEIADLLDDDIELPEGEDERWFSPEEGLTWATTLAAHIRANPDSVTEPEGCLEDLAEYIEVLEKTRSIGAQWHLNIDI